MPIEDKDLNFIPDIQEMMYGLGDSPKPLRSTAEVIEEIVLDQLNSIIHQGEENCNKRGSKVISPQDLLFLLRKDKLKLQRLINYLTVKDQKTNFQNNGLSFSTNGDLESENPSYSISTQSNRSQICVAYLRDLGVDVSTDPSKQIFDVTRNRRQLRADWISKALSSTQYKEFTKCRQASFHGKFRKVQRFLDWLTVKHGESVVAKLKVSTYDILVYLAKETIAELIDLVFFLRQDKMANPGDPYSKAHVMNAHSSSRQEVYGSNSKVECITPVTPEEIREVVRRYWSRQFCPFGLFARQFSLNNQNKIMSHS